jgi:hypothetical protein
LLDLGTKEMLTKQNKNNKGNDLHFPKGQMKMPRIVSEIFMTKLIPVLPSIKALFSHLKKSVKIEYIEKKQSK